MKLIHFAIIFIQVIAICSLVVFANAGLLPDPHAYEVHSPAHYDFSYSVHDSHSGDVKQQQESRRGDAVQGSYSLVEPDGHKRTVHYADDGHSGFNAVVEREGTVHHAPIAHAAPVHVAHAPLAVAHAAPLAVAHAAPLAVAHAAPLAVAHAAPLAVAHAGHGPVSHQSFSTGLVHQQAYAQPQAYVQPQAAYVQHQLAAPAYQTYAGHGYAGQGYASNAYAGHGLAAHSTGYSTVSQVTHHGGYHH